MKLKTKHKNKFKALLVLFYVLLFSVSCGEVNLKSKNSRGGDIPSNDKFPFDFTDQEKVNYNSNVLSDILKVTGLDSPIDFTIKNSPNLNQLAKSKNVLQFRIILMGQIV